MDAPLQGREPFRQAPTAPAQMPWERTLCIQEVSLAPDGIRQEKQAHAHKPMARTRIQVDAIKERPFWKLEFPHFQLDPMNSVMKLLRHAREPNAMANSGLQGGSN